MKCCRIIKKYENWMLTLIVMAINVLFMEILFDFYYDLNDDSLMHDIMSGVYSGIPDGHNMQTLYPLGVLIAMCYKMYRAIPWYGLFLCLCQFGCFYLIGVRLCSLRDDMVQSDSSKTFVSKILRLLMLSLFQWGIWLPHFINIQYTITCAMLSAAAVFLFMTTAEGLSTRQFIIKNIPCVLLVIVAYMLRTEMLLLMFPFICLAGLYRLTGEKRVFAKENLIRYGSVMGIMLAGMLFSSVLDHMAYSSPEWKDFRSFFDARTTIYDFYPELISDDGYSDVLAQLGVGAPQKILLDMYDYALDDTIDTGFLTKLADYATSKLRASKDWVAIARDQIYAYFYRTTHMDDAPYNIIVFWAYAGVFAAGCLTCRKNQYTFLWQIVLLAAVRSAIWMFILMRGRYPGRITHSLYLIEFSLLTAMFARMYRDLRDCGKTAGIVVRYGMPVSFILLTAGLLTMRIPGMRGDQDMRSGINAGWYEIDAYCREHEDNFYFEDVFSVVQFSRRMFEKTDNRYANYDYMGGWMCKSPLYYEKLRQYDIDSVQDALLNRDNVYLIMSDQSISDSGVGWIEDYYRSGNIEVKVEQADIIGDSYLVLRIVEQ